MQDEEIRSIVKITVPVLLATLGFIGFTMAKDDPSITTKRFVGGIITAGFVAWGVTTIMSSLGVPADMSSVCGAVLGSQGPTGAYLLVNKVKKIFEVK